MPTFPDISFQLSQGTACHLPSLNNADDRGGYFESRILTPGLALKQGVGCRDQQPRAYQHAHDHFPLRNYFAEDRSPRSYGP